MTSDCGSTCPTENGFFTADLNIGGSAVLLAVFAFLTPATFYLGYRFRTPGFSAVLATGLSFEVVGFLGRILLHEARDHQGYFALTLLGSVLGPTFMSGAMSMVLPHLLAIYGQGHAPCQSILATSLLCVLFIVSLVLDIIGIVFVAYGYGGVSVCISPLYLLTKLLLTRWEARSECRYSCWRAWCPNPLVTCHHGRVRLFHYGLVS